MEVNHDVGRLLQQLGLPQGFIEQASSSGASPQQLRAWVEAYGPDALASNQFTAQVRDGRVDIPPAGFNPPPPAVLASGGRSVAAQFYSTPWAGRSTPTSPEGLWAGLMHPRRTRGVQMARLVGHTPVVAQALAPTLGGPVQPGTAPHRIAVTRPAQAGATNGAPNTIYDAMMAMDQAILDKAKELGLYQSSGGLTPGAQASPQTRLAGAPPWAQHAFQPQQGALPVETSMGLLWPSAGPDALWPPAAATVSALRHGAASATPESMPMGPGQANGSAVDVAVMQLKRMQDKREQLVTLHKNAFKAYVDASRTATDNMRA